MATLLTKLMETSKILSKEVFQTDKYIVTVNNKHTKFTSL